MATDKTPSAGSAGNLKAHKIAPKKSGARRIKKGFIGLIAAQENYWPEESRLITKSANGIPLTRAEKRRLAKLQPRIVGGMRLAEFQALEARNAKAAKEKITPEGTGPSRGRVKILGISGAKGEGFLNETLSSVLTSWGVPEAMHREMAAELERIAKARANAARRPKWEERGNYAELKNLSAPQFLKRVYGDLIASDGAIEKQAIRDIDPKLMASVEVYMSNRKKREQDAGDAAGLRLIAGPTSPHRPANLS